MMPTEAGMASGTSAKLIDKPQTAVVRGYSVEVEEASSGDKDKKEINIFAMIASASAESGEKVAKKCLACHSFDKGGQNKVGPNLWDTLGNQYAKNPDFQYSKAFTDLQGGWDYENLWAFLNNPKKYIKGTKMAFAGIKKPNQLADLIVYIRAQSDKPYPLPEVKVEETSEGDSSKK